MMTQLQTNNGTYLGRYWNELSVLRRYFPSDLGLSILSFGCATGEEIATVRMLFPNARMYGCDIDWHSLRAARALLGSDAAVFDSTPAEIARHGPFDIILCNSVLLRPTTVVAGRKRGIDAALWSDTVSMLDQALAPGGVIQVINSNMPFRLHSAAQNYEVLASPLVIAPHFVDQFDIDSTHLCSGIAGTGFSPVPNRHLGEEGWSRLQPGDLRHVHFRKQGGPPTQPVVDETIPNGGGGKPLVSGSCTVRSAAPADRRPSSFVEIDIAWETAGAEFVKTRRTVRRIWFDGAVAETFSSEADLAAGDAGVFLEAVSGRRPTKLALDAFLSPAARRTPAF